MRRLIPFVVIASICGYLGWWISEQLGYALDGTSFTVGIAVAAVTGFLWFLVSDWWSTATRPWRPQAVTLPTRETPSQIGCAALCAMMWLVFFAVGVIAVIVWAVWFG
jgi:hypothetical protein